MQGIAVPDRFDACLTFTLRAEGGFVDDPADPGGATNMGITLATYRDCSNDQDLGAVQVEDMTRRTARAIYRTLYWNPLRADALPDGVDLSVFDMGVNAGMGAQTPPSSSPPQAPQVAQVPGKTPQERCYYRYMTAHGYHHAGPKTQAACPDPNQQQPNN
jgi:Glycosyl hydrolase 108